MPRSWRGRRIPGSRGLRSDSTVAPALRKVHVPHGIAELIPIGYARRLRQSGRGA
jgi:hypothetical protein